MEHHDRQPQSPDQESKPIIVPSSTSRGSALPKSSLETHGTKTSPTHTSAAVSSNISASPSTTIPFGSNSRKVTAGSPSQVKENQEYLSGENKRFAKLESLINESSSFELEELRKLAWSGISSKARAKAWKILCGYLPPPGTAAIRYAWQE